MELISVKTSSLHDYLFELYGPTTTPEAIAKPILHMHPTTCRRLCAEGILPGVKIGRQWIIPTGKLVAVIESGEIRAD